MKTVTELTTQAMQHQRSGEVASVSEWTEEQREAGKKQVNDLFKSLQASFPAWKQAFPTTQELNLAKQVWVRALLEAGITEMEQIKLGTRKARASGSAFFPAVGQFIQWCKPTPEDLGLPSERDAYHEACNHAHAIYAHTWSHPAVYEAGRRTGWFELRSEEAARMQKAFGTVYADVCKSVMAGAEFEVPKPKAGALEHHTNGNRIKTKSEIATGRAALAALKGKF